MKWIFKLIILCIFCLCLLFGERVITAVHPNWLNSIQLASISGTFSTHEDGIPWMQKILTEFTESYQHLPISKKRNDSLWFVTLPQGFSDVEYLLQLKNISKKYGIQMVSGNKISKNKNRYFLSVILQPKQFSTEYLIPSSKEIRFRMGKSYLQGIAKIAFLFYGIDTLTRDNFLILNNQPYQKNFVLNSNQYSDLFYHYLSSSTENEVYMLLNMESSRYPYVKPGPNAIYIHNSVQEIRKNLNQKLKIFPKTKGFVTWHGNRSMEHRPLLLKLFSELKKNKMSFINMIKSRNKIPYQVSQELHYSILETSKTSLESLKEITFSTIMNRKVKQALKKGYEIVALPYSKPIIDSISQYINQRDWKFKKIDLVHISKLIP